MSHESGLHVAAERDQISAGNRLTPRERPHQQNRNEHHNDQSNECNRLAHSTPHGEEIVKVTDEYSGLRERREGAFRKNLPMFAVLRPILTNEASARIETAANPAPPLAVPRCMLPTRLDRRAG